MQGSLELSNKTSQRLFLLDVRVHSYTKLDASALVDEMGGSHFGVLVWGVGDCWASWKLKGGVGKVKRRGKRNLKDFIGYQMEVA